MLSLNANKWLGPTLSLQFITKYKWPINLPPMYWPFIKQFPYLLINATRKINSVLKLMLNNEIQLL